MEPYPEEIEQKMLKFYQSLSEKERRYYAAIEAIKLGWGGVSYICNLLGSHAPELKKILAQAGCYFHRQGKGDREIWYSPITDLTDSDRDKFGLLYH